MDFSTLDPYQETVSREKVTHKIETYLQKSSAVADYYKITEDAFVLYASGEDKNNDRPEYILKFGTQPSPERDRFIPAGDETAPLRGLKVAIDPGHFGGPMARLEARYVDMQPSDQTGNRKDIQFDEGTLTLVTAKYLKTLLVEQGANVFLTKENIGEGAGKSLTQWKEEDFLKEVDKKVEALPEDKREAAKKWWLTEAPEGTIFNQLYNPYDLRTRAQKINEFKPHLAFIIHYNAGADNNKQTGQNLGTSENYSMTFVPGSFMAGELDKSRVRYEFVRLLVTDDFEESVRLAGAVMRNFERQLAVPAVNEEENAFARDRYLRGNCIQIESGVYARNLGLTQRVQSPLCYGESLCQDNFEECLRLVNKDAVIDGVPTSSRVKQVAQAYFQSVLDFYGLRRKGE